MAEERIPYESMPELDDKISALDKLITFMKFDDWAEIRFEDDEEEPYYYVYDREFGAPLEYAVLLNEISDNIFGPSELEAARLTDEEKAIILAEFERVLGTDIDYMI